MYCKQLLMALSFFSAFAATAQTDGYPFDESRDVLKVNITSLALKNVSVQYEYLLSRKISLALGGRVMPSTALPMKGLLIGAFANGDQDTKDIINKSRLGNVAITPEVRFYLGKGWGRGFYFAPYYRFAQFSSNTLILNYSEANGPKRSLTLDGDVTTHSAGLMAGAQWFLGSHLVLDWWIAGAHYGIESGTFSGIPSRPFTESEQADVQRNIDDLKIPLINKTATVTQNSVLINTDGGYGGLRAGICLGIRF